MVGPVPPEEDLPAPVRPYLRSPPPADQPPPDDAPGELSGLRPFVLTSGRVTTDDAAIGLETQVSSRTGSAPEPPTPQLQAIVALCRDPLSVAEISAHLHLHLGVTKILVGDLHATGHVDIHRLDAELSHDPETILRVIRGLRAIS